MLQWKRHRNLSADILRGIKTHGETVSKRIFRNRKWLYILSTLHVCTTDLSWKTNCTTRQPAHPTACVMAQKRSDATFQPLHYHFHKAHFQIFHNCNFLFFKLPNLKLPKSGTVHNRIFFVFSGTIINFLTAFYKVIQHKDIWRTIIDRRGSGVAYFKVPSYVVPFAKKNRRTPS
jgi:hypothetical protein